ncbi:hypothetical protein [Streptomyces litchfieldiae]|uniref:Integral membrane protein n=1 Tax=Streptomyces litchfieldiae TaxID=3075543 RepID=A0ABU2MTZ6_9ACTN|nr:hypothetical protein [Streptomyces sp. DSM 44938]MDT0345015.1 hypothetical protein [Streptomyces sp. DSM 44938]
MSDNPSRHLAYGRRPEVTHPMKSLHRSASRLSATAVALTALSLGLAGPALAQDDARPAAGNVSPLTISPSSGGAGTTVTVKSSCQPSGPATSEAFQQSITLRQSNSQWIGTGRIRTSGLQVGRTYPVTVRCTDGVTLSTSFTFTSGTPSGGASAGFGGGAGAGNGGGAQATALAVGGGITVAGTIGYLFLARRRRAGNHY